MSDALPPGASIGILGGGQLGRMLALAAARLGLRCHVFDPDPNAPAFQVSDRATVAPYTDSTALSEFAASVDVVTFEFENIPTEALDILEKDRPIRPSRRALAVSQDRFDEKTFLTGLGLGTAPFATVDGPEDLSAALDTVGVPGILKTRRFGYDGKGQARITSADQAETALASLNGAPALYEGFVDFRCEVSVIGARGLDGSVACFDPGENVHRDGILRETRVPSSLGIRQRSEAVLLTGQILNALDYVGVLGVELFVTSGGLLVNEIAPRVHNSGHWTQNGCAICQFEQHVRAVSGWPLGDGKRHSDVAMTNLIGSDVDQIDALRSDPTASLHLYGKSETREGRKMGHVNRILTPD